MKQSLSELLEQYESGRVSDGEKWLQCQSRTLKKPFVVHDKDKGEFLFGLSASLIQSKKKEASQNRL